MPEVSLLRLYVLRVMYLLIALGEGSIIWPTIFHHRPWDDVMHGVAVSLLGALTLVALLGVRYPLRTLPLLLFEFAWKTLWMLAIALPAWRAHAITVPIQENIPGICMGVVLTPLVLPWGYLWRNYVLAPGDRWRS